KIGLLEILRVTNRQLPPHDLPGVVGRLMSGELEKRCAFGDQWFPVDIAARKASDGHAMMVGVPHNSAVRWRNRISIVDTQQNSGWRAGKLAEMNILEDIEDRELPG